MLFQRDDVTRQSEDDPTLIIWEDKRPAKGSEWKDDEENEGSEDESNKEAESDSEGGDISSKSHLPLKCYLLLLGYMCDQEQAEEEVRGKGTDTAIYMPEALPKLQASQNIYASALLGNLLAIYIHTVEIAALRNEIVLICRRYFSRRHGSRGARRG